MARELILGDPRVLLDIRCEVSELHVALTLVGVDAHARWGTRPVSRIAMAREVLHGPVLDAGRPPVFGAPFAIHLTG